MTSTKQKKGVKSIFSKKNSSRSDSDKVTSGRLSINESKKTKTFVNTKYKKCKTELKASTTLPHPNPQIGATLIERGDKLPFDGTQVKFSRDLKSKVYTDAYQLFEWLGACRPNKPCHNWNPYAPLTFHAKYLVGDESNNIDQDCIIKVMMDNTKSINHDKNGEPRQIMINLRKKYAGLNSVGMNWCVVNGKPKLDIDYLNERIEDRDEKTMKMEDHLGRNLSKLEKDKLSVETRPNWSLKGQPKNFTVEQLPTRYIIMRDDGYRRVLQTVLRDDPNWFNNHPTLKFEAMWIIVFKTIYTYDNHFAQIMVSDDDTKLLSIDEEDLASDIVDRMNKCKKAVEENWSLSEYYEYIIKSSVKTIPNFFDDMKKAETAKKIVNYLNDLLKVEKSINNKELDLEPFKQAEDNIKAMINLFNSY